MVKWETFVDTMAAIFCLKKATERALVYYKAASD